MNNAEPQDRERRIRARAHQLWLDEGQPSDREAEHWHRAEEMINAEDRRVAPDPAPPEPSPEESSVVSEVAASFSSPRRRG